MKSLKRLFVMCLSALLVVLLSTQLFAATIYHSNGYSYTDMDEESNLISLCGWDNRSTDLVVPDSIGRFYFGEIANYGLKDNTGFESLDLTQASNLRRIGMYAFDGCEGLSGEVVIPFRVKEIGVSSFQNCFQLESAVIYANVKSIPSQMFYNCSSLNNVVLPTNLEKIDNLAFANCYSLKTIQIPQSVNSISKSAFSKCNGLVIQCYRGSYAEQFAKDNSIEFEILDPVKGDTNGSDKIDINDATLIQKYKAGIITLSRTALRAADVNGDGQVTVRDATLIQMRIANIINEF